MVETTWNFSQQTEVQYHQIQWEDFWYLHRDQNSAQGCFDHCLHLSDRHFHKEKDSLKPTQTYIQKKMFPVFSWFYFSSSYPKHHIQSLLVPASMFTYVSQKKAFQQ